MKWLHLWALAFMTAFAKGQERDLLLPASADSESEENTKLLLPSPKVAADIETDSSPARQRPQQGPGWGGLISGLLGTITKTADVSDCPGKCLHALASLLCEEVKEDISCPSQSMRCCVDRKHMQPGGPPSQNLDDANLETTTNFRVRPVPAKTTTVATTTTTRTTTNRTPAKASDKQDKFGDYDYTDSDSTASASTTSKTASAFFVTVLCMIMSFSFL